MSETDWATRPSLLIRIRDPRDAESWAEFVAVYQPLILYFARERGLQEADAADVAQDALVQVASAIRRFQYQPERGRFRDWLGTLVRHRVYRFLRREAKRGVADGEGLEELPADGSNGAWSEAIDAHILRAALERARPHFEESTWAAFYRTWYEQEPASTVALKLGLPISSVYLAKSRVLKRLRDEAIALADDWPLAPAESSARS